MPAAGGREVLRVRRELAALAPLGGNLDVGAATDAAGSRTSAGVARLDDLVCLMFVG